jgi:hypothetical protein
MTTAHSTSIPASVRTPGAFPASARIAKHVIARLEEGLSKIERSISWCEVVGAPAWPLEAAYSRVDRSIARLEVFAAA